MDRPPSSVRPFPARVASWCCACSRSPPVASGPNRKWQASVRNTESSTQAVIRAVTCQVLAHQRVTPVRALSVRRIQAVRTAHQPAEFIRQVAPPRPFRGPLLVGLTLPKRIEVIQPTDPGRPHLRAFAKSTAIRPPLPAKLLRRVSSTPCSQAGSTTIASARTALPYERFHHAMESQCPPDSHLSGQTLKTQRPGVPLRSSGPQLPAKNPSVAAAI